MITIIRATQDDAKRLETIARPIWQEHYTPIIGAEQVAYMLEKFQSEAVVKQQIEQGFEYYIVLKDQQAAGYIGLDVKDDRLFISKFYLSSDFRGQGIGHKMLAHCNDGANQKGLSTLKLTVNKYNFAYQAYLKMGFKNVDSVVADIGNGYVMDDFILEKAVS